MVILVDDEDDRHGEHEEVPYETRSARPRGSSYEAEARSWDERRQRANMSDVSTNIRSDTAETQGSGETGRPKTRRPIFRQPSEKGDPAQLPLAADLGPKACGRAFPVTSESEPHLSIDAEWRSSNGGAENEPTSQDSTFVPVQTTMQPQLKIAGRSNFDADGARKAPINMPGRSGAKQETSIDARPSARRTYKSLSPYSILFED